MSHKQKRTRALQAVVSLIALSRDYSAGVNTRNRRGASIRALAALTTPKRLRAHMPASESDRKRRRTAQDLTPIKSCDEASLPPSISPLVANRSGSFTLRIAVPDDFSLAQSVCSYGYFVLAPNRWCPPRTSEDPEKGEFTRPLTLSNGAVFHM
jgi:hypothetical protein